MSPQRKRPIDLGVIAEVVRASDYLIKSAQRPQQNKIFGRKVMDKLNPIQMRKPSPLSSTRIVGLATSQQRRPSIQNPYENHKKPKNQKRKTPTKQKTKKTKNPKRKTPKNQKTKKGKPQRNKKPKKQKTKKPPERQQRRQQRRQSRRQQRRQQRRQSRRQQRRQLEKELIPPKLARKK